MKKIKSFILSCMLIFSSIFGALRYESIVLAADTALYPAQAVNFTAYTTARNLNKSNTSLNTQIASGSTTENWRIDYVSSGVYNIVNMSDNSYLTANETKCITSSASGNSNQQWNIIGTDKDFLGNYLYYKIVNVSTGKAITYYQKDNSIGLDQYTNDGAQKWKLNCYGLEGFAANSKMSEGEKAGTIGGLLGETVFVSDMKSMKEALLRTEPLTIVLTANIDCSGENYDWMIEDNKTIIGSYQANQMRDCKLRTNDYYGKLDPSDNIIIRNMKFQVEVNPNMLVLAIYSSKNIWVDHCTFNSDLNKNRDEVGKFIWINTPFDGKDLSRSPDCITLSYNIFKNRYWTIAYGTQNGETNKCRTSVMYNMWDSCIRRCPQIGNGTGHIYNNYHVNNDGSINDGTSQIIPGEGSVILSENCRFEGLKKVEAAIDKNAKYKDSGSYTSDTLTSEPYPLSNNLGSYTSHSWNPGNENYGYSLISAYKSNSKDVKTFCSQYSGCVKSSSALKYIYDSDCSSFIEKTISSPFLTEGFNSQYGTLTTEITAAVLKEGAVYMIKNANSGMYMEVKGGTAADGTNVQQWGAETSASHNTWRVLSAGDGYYYLYSQIDDKITYLLDVNGNKTDNGTNIGIWSATDADAQKFKFVQNSDGTYQIRTKTSNDASCVEIADASTSSGANVQQWTANGNSCQNWILEQVEDTGCVMDTNAVYMFKNSNSSLYMEVQGGTAANNSNIQQWGANGVSKHNSWTLKSFGGGYYYIISQLDDGKTYYLNIENGSGINGANAEILTNNKTSSHLFKFVKNPDGTYNILTRASKDICAVEVADASKNSGANVQQWEVNSNSCQKWIAEKSPIVTTTVTTSAITTSITTTKTTTYPITTTSPITSDDVQKGDINSDKSVNVSDIVSLQKYLIKTEQLNESGFKAADLNDDNKINIFDLVILKRIIISG